MTKLRNKFSYLMWAIFAILLSVMFFSAAVEVLNGVSLLNSAYNRIIVILFSIILIESIILFDNLFNKSKTKNTDSSINVLGITGFLISLAAFCGYRFFEMSNILSKISAQGNIDEVYAKSFIGAEGKLYIAFNNVWSIFATVLSICFKFFGNDAFGILAAQLIISFVSFLLIYFGSLKLYGRMEAFIAGIGMAMLPVFMPNGEIYADYTVKVCLFAIGFFLIAMVQTLLDKDGFYYPALIVVSAIIGFLYLYEGMCAPLIALFILIIFEKEAFAYGEKIIGVILSIIFFIMGSFGVVALQALFAYSDIKDVLQTLEKFVVYRMSGSFDVAALTTFANNNFLLIVLIACIAYVVTFLRCRFDEAHSVILLFLLNSVAMCFISLEGRISYEIVGTAELLIIAGAGIKKLIMSEFNLNVSCEEEVVEAGKTDKDLEEVKTLEDGIEILCEAKNEEVSDVEIPTVSSIIAANSETGNEIKETEENSFNMAALDWSKLKDAKLIDYPDAESIKITSQNMDGFKTTDAKEKDSEIQRTKPVQNINKNLDYDYEVDEKDMHYDLDINFD